MTIGDIKTMACCKAKVHEIPKMVTMRGLLDCCPAQAARVALLARHRRPSTTTAAPATSTSSSMCASTLGTSLS